MFGNLRSLSAGVQDLAAALRHISEVLPEVLTALETAEPLETRLAELERARSQWEAQVEAELLRADSKFKQARNAEERTRTMAANAKALADSDEGEDAVRDEYLEFLRGNGEAAGDEEVPTLPAPVAYDPSARAIAAKFRGVA